VSNAVTKSPALTDKERLFVSEYLIDLNAGQVALRARFGGGSVAAARVAGHLLRRKPHVADAISKAIAERTGATRARIVEEVFAPRPSVTWPTCQRSKTARSS
jgi:phage terminase small subunit